MTFLAVGIVAPGKTSVTVGKVSLGPTDVPHKGRRFVAGQRAILGLRPRYLRPAADGSGKLRGRVIQTERRGCKTVVEVALADGTGTIAAFAQNSILCPAQLRISSSIRTPRICSKPARGGADAE